jgi:hypothetical protein
MADTKLSELPAADAIGDGDIMYIVQDGVSKKIPASDVGGAGGTSESSYWAARAAMLDPLAYEWFEGSSWSFTVPDGETWYLREAWNACLGTAGPNIWIRSPQTFLPLPEGTTVAANGTAHAHAYVCKPSEVSGADSRYSNSKGLYFDRLQVMGSLILNAHNVTTGGSTGPTFYSALPTDFDYGMVTNAHVFDGAWVGLSNGARTAVLNLGPEISDLHQFRHGTPFGDLPLPFTRSILPDLAGNAASVSGTGGGAENGDQGITYIKLPAGF